MARLKGGSGATSADNIVLKNQLEDAQKSKAKLEQDYMRSHTEKLVLESQLAALRDGGPIDEGYYNSPLLIFTSRMSSLCPFNVYSLICFHVLYLVQLHCFDPVVLSLVQCADYIGPGEPGYLKI